MQRIRSSGDPVVALDAGDLVPDGSELSTLKLQTLLMGLQVARYDAVAVGGEDAAYPAEEFRSLAEGVGIRTVAPADGRVTLLAPPKGAARVAVWPAPQLRPAEGAALAPGAGDVRIALVPMDLDAAAVWARTRSSLHVVVATRDDYATPRYRALGETCLVTSTGMRGEYLVAVRVQLRGASPSRVDVRYIALDDALPPSPAGSALVAAYQERLREERVVERTPRLPLPAGQRYAGAQACRRCHEAAFKNWSGSRHARAFASITKQQRVFDPDCVRCHVTGFPQATGYVSREATGHLTDVGCESCHGPSATHAARPATKTPGKAREACVTCHTAEHSPHYAPEGYLARIRHW